MNKTTSPSEGDNLSRIKDILFGDDLQSIEEKLGTTKDESFSAIDKLRHEMDSRLTKIEDAENKQLKMVKSDFEKITDSQKAVINNLKDEVASLNKKVSALVSEYESLLNARIVDVIAKIDKSELILKQSISKIEDNNNQKYDKIVDAALTKENFSEILKNIASNIQKKP